MVFWLCFDVLNAAMRRKEIILIRGHRKMDVVNLVMKTTPTEESLNQNLLALAVELQSSLIKLVEIDKARI